MKLGKKIGVLDVQLDRKKDRYHWAKVTRRSLAEKRLRKEGWPL